MEPQDCLQELPCFFWIFQKRLPSNSGCCSIFPGAEKCFADALSHMHADAHSNAFRILLGRLFHDFLTLAAPRFFAQLTFFTPSRSLLVGGQRRTVWRFMLGSSRFPCSKGIQQRYLAGRLGFCIHEWLEDVPFGPWSKIFGQTMPRSGPMRLGSWPIGSQVWPRVLDPGAMDPRHTAASRQIASLEGPPCHSLHCMLV